MSLVIFTLLYGLAGAFVVLVIIAGTRALAKRPDRERR